MAAEQSDNNMDSGNTRSATADPMHHNGVVLAGDIGGTNARFVLFVDGEYQADTFGAIPVADYSDLSDVVDLYLQGVQHPRVGDCAQAAFSVASTADYRDEINLTNADLRFSISALRKRFSLTRAKVVNDFTAAALGVVCLDDASLLVLHEGIAEPSGPCAVIGPGTGLGVSGLLHTGEYWLPLQGQGGHVSMGAQNDRELAILTQIASVYGHVSAERYLSGTGIADVYQAICTIDGITPVHNSAAEIAPAAIDGSCPVSHEVMSLFCKFLGVVTGDLALTLGSTGGIYLAGGIAPKLGEFFLQSDFLASLHHKGRFSEFVKAMPVRMVIGGEPALYGAYASLASSYDQLGYADSET